MYLASAEQIYERFSQALWGDVSLGQLVVGKKDVINLLSREAILECIQDRYTADNSSIVVVGNVSHQSAFEVVERSFCSWRDNTRSARETVIRPECSIFLQPSDSEQITLCLGFNGLPYGHPDKPKLDLTAKILGHGINSRLVQSVREKRGLAYLVTAYSTSYKFAGAFAAYVKCHRRDVREVICRILEEFNLLKQQPVSESELAFARETLKTEILMQMESTLNRMLLIGRQSLLGGIYSTNEQIRRLKHVIPEDIVGCARRLFRHKSLAMAAIGKINEDELINVLNQ